MTLWEVAFRESVATSVVLEFMDKTSNYCYRGAYGLTMVVDDNDVDLSEYDWAFSMVCSMEQGGF